MLQKQNEKLEINDIEIQLRSKLKMNKEEPQQEEQILS